MAYSAVRHLQCMFTDLLAPCLISKPRWCLLGTTSGKTPSASHAVSFILFPAHFPHVICDLQSSNDSLPVKTHLLCSLSTFFLGGGGEEAVGFSQESSECWGNPGGPLGLGIKLSPSCMQGLNSNPMCYLPRPAMFFWDLER